MHILHGGLPGISWISWAPKVKRDSQDMETQGEVLKAHQRVRMGPNQPGQMMGDLF